MPNVFHFLEAHRTDAGKKPNFVRIKQLGETCGDCEQQGAADPVVRNPVVRCLDYLEV